MAINSYELTGSLSYTDVDGIPSLFKPSIVRFLDESIELHGSHEGGYIPTSDTPSTFTIGDVELKFNDAYIHDPYGTDTQVYIWGVEVEPNDIVEINVPTWHPGTPIWETPRLVWEGVAQPPDPDEDGNVNIALISTFSDLFDEQYSVVITQSGGSVNDLFDGIPVRKSRFANISYISDEDHGVIIHEDSLRDFIVNLSNIFYGQIYEDKCGCLGVSSNILVGIPQGLHDLLSSVRIDSDMVQEKNPLLVRNTVDLESLSVDIQARSKQVDIKGSLIAGGVEQSFTGVTTDDRAIAVDWETPSAFLNNNRDTIVRVISQQAESIEIGITNNSESNIEDFTLSLYGRSFHVTRKQARRIRIQQSIDDGYGEIEPINKKWTSWVTPSQFDSIQQWMQIQSRPPEISRMTLYEWQRTNEDIRTVQNTEVGRFIRHGGKAMLVLSVEIERDIRRSPRRTVHALTLEPLG